MVEYWHWHTLHYGTETYWGGVLPHSGRPGRTYRELARLGAEFEAAGDLVAGLTPDADITMVYSLPSKWLMEKYPPLAREDGSPDPAAYHGLFEPFYRGAFDAGLQIRIVHSRQLVDAHGAGRDIPPDEAARAHPVLVVPALYIVDDPTLDWLGDYAAAGGHLVLGPRTGYADHEARARADAMPAHLTTAAGVWYDEFSNLIEDIPLVPPNDGALALPAHARATRWADALTPTGAAVLARYDHPHFGQWAAITTRQIGDGRITYVGTVPNVDLAKALMSWLDPSDHREWRNQPEAVTATGATTPDGARVRFLHNWSWTPTDLRLPVGAADALTSHRYAAGENLHLGPWDVQVLVEGT
jgi:beta-galactosidase